LVDAGYGGNVRGVGRGGGVREGGGYHW